MYTHMMSAGQNLYEGENIPVDVQCKEQPECVLGRCSDGGSRNKVMSKKRRSMRRKRKSMRKKGIKISRKYKKHMIQKKRVHKRKHKKRSAGRKGGRPGNGLLTGVENAAETTLLPACVNQNRGQCNVSRTSPTIHVCAQTSYRQIRTQNGVQNVYQVNVESKVHVAIQYNASGSPQVSGPIQQRGDTNGLNANSYGSRNSEENCSSQRNSSTQRNSSSQPNGNTQRNGKS
ncbi:hypothetical protein AK88_00241 [Plasmodium fragile]|uniref:Uncharacterized protein n=1 Tax=Plasmodium fragile TaxID=5857 RepID=A0A0D9QTB7_PLAFR|nr:uncharacterized protein AK88_00241 [Plasmodium fragile]KJP90072.1 hypothetical protein AK88_00241 [Plasmodium fragile]